MTFVKMMQELASMESMEQIREALREEWAPPRQPLDELAKQLDRVLPGGYMVSEQDQAERAGRRELTRAMRENMIYMLERKHWWQHEPHYRADSGLSRDLVCLLNLVGENPTKYRRYYEILTGNDPQAKAELVMEAVHSLDDTFRQLRNPPLNNMTDQDIVDNFPMIYHATQVVDQIFALVKNPALALSEEQKNNLLGLEQEFSEPLTGAQSRADSIASSYYELFPTSRFQNVSTEDLYAAMDALGEGNQLGEYLYSKVDMEKGFVAKGLMSEVVQSKLSGWPLEEFTWMDETGAELPLDQWTHIPEVGTTFVEGRPLIARHSGGWTSVYFASRDSDNHGLIAGDTKLLASFGVKDASKRVLDGLKAADPWYISSSKEFKAMRSSMEAMEKVCRSLENPPTTRQLMELRELSQQLERTSEAYLEYKGPEGKNETERSRINAARGVHEFAKRQSARMNTLFSLEPALEAEAERIKEEDRRQKQEETRRKFEALDSFLFDKQPQRQQPQRPEKKKTVEDHERELQWDVLSDLESDPLFQKFRLGTKAKERLKSVEEKYPVQSDQPTSALNDLRSMILHRVEIMNGRELEDIMDEEVERAMILMTAYDLIAQERNGRETPGPMERLFQKSVKALFSAVEQNSDVKKTMEGSRSFIPEWRLEQFMKDNEGRRLAGRILGKAKEPVGQQPAQRPQPVQTLSQTERQKSAPAQKNK